MLSVLLLLVLVPLLWVQLTAHTARSLLHNPAFPLEAVRQSGVGREMQRLLVDQIAVRFQGPQAPFPFTRDEVNTIVTRVLPAARLEAMTETAVEGLYRWFHGSEAKPKIELDLTEARAALPAVLTEVISAKIEALPVCTLAQAADLMRNYKGGMPPCKSPNAAFNRGVVDMAVKRANVETLLPAKVDVTGEIERREGLQFWTSLNEDLAWVRRFLNLVPVGWGVAGALLLLLALLNLDRWHRAFGWVGAALLLGGGLPLAIAWTEARAALPWISSGVSATSPTDALALSVVKVALESLAVALRSVSQTVALAGAGGIALALAGRTISRDEA